MRSETAQTPARTSDTHRRGARLAGVAAAIACAAFTLALLHPAIAHSASLAEKQALASKITGQVDQLDTQLSDLQERFRGASDRLASLDANVHQLSADLERQQRDLVVAQQRLTDRAITVYENGAATSELVHLAQARSFSNFLDRIDTIHRVGQQDANVVDEIRVLRARIATRRAELKTARAEQGKLVVQARHSRDQIASKLHARQAVLGSVNAEIRTMVDAQRRAEAAAAAAASRAAAARLRPGTGVAAASVDAGALPASTTDAGTALSAPSPAPAPSGGASSAASIAMGFIGTPYVWGGASPSGFDCSGLVMYSFGRVGISLPHSSYALWNMGTHVSRDQLAVGDLVFFSGLGHVGIYVGGGNFVHAPHTGDVVKVSSMNDSYGTSSYVGAVRI